MVASISRLREQQVGILIKKPDLKDDSNVLSSPLLKFCSEIASDGPN